jgi:hypothetical protein
VEQASNECWAQAWLLMHSTLSLLFWLQIQLGESWGRRWPPETLLLLRSS